MGGARRPIDDLVLGADCADKDDGDDNEDDDDTQR